MIGNETGHLLKCLKYQYLASFEGGGGIAAIWLKIACKISYSVKRYDETNMKVFALSQWEI